MFFHYFFEKTQYIIIIFEPPTVYLNSIAILFSITIFLFYVIESRKLTLINSPMIFQNLKGRVCNIHTILTAHLIIPIIYQLCINIDLVLILDHLAYKYNSIKQQPIINSEHLPRIKCLTADINCGFLTSSTDKDSYGGNFYVGWYYHSLSIITLMPRDIVTLTLSSILINFLCINLLPSFLNAWYTRIERWSCWYKYGVHPKMYNFLSFYGM